MKLRRKSREWRQISKRINGVVVCLVSPEHQKDAMDLQVTINSAVGDRQFGPETEVPFSLTDRQARLVSLIEDAFPS